MKTELVHISNVRAGDVIDHNDKIMTVSNSDIKNCSFVGRSIFGDCYNLGYKPVRRVIYA